MNALNKLCKLCQDPERKADKKNTHYLTDAIIRTALNIDGSNKRGRGLYFDLSSTSPFVEFGFQQATPTHTLEDELERELTDAERDKARYGPNPYAVDDCFCSKCEDIFTAIETQFTDKLLLKFRGASHPVKEIVIADTDTDLLRVFFYLQIWRSAACANELSLPADTMESLRKIILDYPAVAKDEIRRFPLSVTYLENSGDAFATTENLVGFTSSGNPYIVLFNYFILQFFDNEKAVKKVVFGTLNGSDFEKFVNVGETKFLVKVFSDDERKRLLEARLQRQVQRTKEFIAKAFTVRWMEVTGSAPILEMLAECESYVVNSESSLVDRYSEKNLRAKIEEFISIRQRYFFPRHQFYTRLGSDTNEKKPSSLYSAGRGFKGKRGGAK